MRRAQNRAQSSTGSSELNLPNSSNTDYHVKNQLRHGVGSSRLEKEREDEKAGREPGWDKVSASNTPETHSFKQSRCADAYNMLRQTSPHAAALKRLIILRWHLLSAKVLMINATHVPPEQRFLQNGGRDEGREGACDLEITCDGCKGVDDNPWHKERRRTIDIMHCNA